MENLMIPRFEIIADYPGCPYNLGRILTPVTKRMLVFECVEAPASSLIKSPEDYPHLFKKLQWWENRNESEMPEYIRSLAYPSVYKILKWHGTFGQVEPDSMSGCDLTAFTPEYGYVPATKEEYETYQKQSK